MNKIEFLIIIYINFTIPSKRIKMRLSEVLVYYDPQSDSQHDSHYDPDKKYLVFRRGGSLIITKDLKYFNNEGDFPYVLKYRKVVNLEYLYYYFKLHMGLLQGPEYNKDNMPRLDHLNVEFINNIKIPKLSERISFKIQKKLVPFIRRLYEADIGYFDNKIEELFEDSCANFDCVMESDDVIDISTLYKIKNQEMFSYNTRTGKFQDPIGDYVEILKPEILDEEFLVYCIHYTDRNDICLPSLSKQKEIMESVKPIHDNMNKLKAEQRENKLTLRKLIDDV